MINPSQIQDILTSVVELSSGTLLFHEDVTYFDRTPGAFETLTIKAASLTADLLNPATIGDGLQITNIAGTDYLAALPTSPVQIIGGNIGLGFNAPLQLAGNNLALGYDSTLTLSGTDLSVQVDPNGGLAAGGSGLSLTWPSATGWTGNEKRVVWITKSGTTYTYGGDLATEYYKVMTDSADPTPKYLDDAFSSTGTAATPVGGPDVVLSYLDTASNKIWFDVQDNTLAVNHLSSGIDASAKGFVSQYIGAASWAPNDAGAGATDIWSANKIAAYVAAAVAGAPYFIEPVDQRAAAAPGGPVLGDRYLNTTDKNIYEYDGAIWNVTTAPAEGNFVWSVGDKAFFVYDAVLAAYKDISAALDHTQMQNLNSASYHHLSQANHTTLTTAVNADALHVHSLGSGLDDVVIGAANAGDILQYNGAAWADVSFPLTIGALVDKHILVYNLVGTTWENVSFSNFSIEDLGDVDTSTVSPNDILVYNNGTGNWEDEPFSTFNIGDLGNVNTGGVAANHILRYNNGTTNWETLLFEIASAEDTNFGALAANDFMVYDGAGDWENKTLAQTIAIIGGTMTLGDLSDVDVTGVNVNDIIFWDGVKWDVGPEFPHSIGAHTDVSITAAADKEVLMYNSTTGKWEDESINADDLENIDLTGLVNGDVLVYNGGTSNFEPVAGSSLASAGAFVIIDGVGAATGAYATLTAAYNAIVGAGGTQMFAVVTQAAAAATPEPAGVLTTLIPMTIIGTALDIAGGGGGSGFDLATNGTVINAGAPVHYYGVSWLVNLVAAGGTPQISLITDSKVENNTFISQTTGVLGALTPIIDGSGTNVCINNSTIYFTFDTTNECFVATAPANIGWSIRDTHIAAAGVGAHANTQLFYLNNSLDTLIDGLFMASTGVSFTNTAAISVVGSTGSTLSNLHDVPITVTSGATLTFDKVTDSVFNCVAGMVNSNITNSKLTSFTDAAGPGVADNSISNTYIVAATNFLGNAWLINNCLFGALLTVTGINCKLSNSETLGAFVTAASCNGCYIDNFQVATTYNNVIGGQNIHANNIRVGTNYQIDDGTTNIFLSNSEVGGTTTIGIAAGAGALLVAISNCVLVGAVTAEVNSTGILNGCRQTGGYTDNTGGVFNNIFPW